MAPAFRRRMWVGALSCALAAMAIIVVVARRSEATATDRLATDHNTCGFDFPVGPPDATGYYDAQPFGDNDHLGNDWNGNGGGDSDLGDPVFAIADGVVTEAVDHGGGWGNVVRIVHRCGAVESLSAHLDTIDVAEGTTVTRGQRIGTIGTAHGQYPAHLHFELRDRDVPVGGGYGTDRAGYLDPTAFIRAHRAR